MAGEFGKFIDKKRKCWSDDSKDILLKAIVNAMGTTAIYLSGPIPKK